MKKEEMNLHRKRISMEALAELLLLQMENGGKARLTVTGYSMMPMLHNRRDYVDLVKADGKQKKGDIILYRRENGAYVLHRIIAVEGGGYICCGDNQYMRETVNAEQVLAVVVGFCRGGKYAATDQLRYRLYVSLWIGLFPLRGVYIAVRRRLGRLRRACKRKK